MYTVPLTLLFAVSFVRGLDPGDGCFSTKQCGDVGLTCTGAACWCLMDISPELTEKFWACNQPEDCNQIAGQALNHAAEGLVATPPKCTPSQKCRQPNGFVGYCDIAMAA